MDIQAQVTDHSALKEACGLRSQCSTFKRVLDSADPTKLNDIVHGTQGDRGLFHILVSDDSQISNNKLKVLIRKGIDVNGKTIYSTPAISLYIHSRASQGTRILLDAGANPNLQDSRSWDSLATAAQMNDIDFLEKVKTIAENDSVAINWRQNVTILSRATAKKLYSHCNALHLTIRY